MSLLSIYYYFVNHSKKEFVDRVTKIDDDDIIKDVCGWGKASELRGDIANAFLDLMMGDWKRDKIEMVTEFEFEQLEYEPITIRHYC